MALDLFLPTCLLQLFWRPLPPVSYFLKGYSRHLVTVRKRVRPPTLLEDPFRGPHTFQLRAPFKNVHPFRDAPIYMEKCWGERILKKLVIGREIFDRKNTN